MTMPNPNEFNNGFGSGANPDGHLSNYKVDRGGLIHEADERPDLSLSSHYVDKYGTLSEIIDSAKLAQCLRDFDAYLKRLDYATTGGRGEDLYLIKEDELSGQIDGLIKIYHNVMKEGYAIMAKTPAERTPADRKRAGELLDYLREIKARRKEMAGRLNRLDGFPEEEVWRQTHIQKDRFAEIALTDLDIEDSYLFFTERKLFDISREDPRN